METVIRLTPTRSAMVCKVTLGTGHRPFSKQTVARGAARPRPDGGRGTRRDYRMRASGRYPVGATATDTW
ncbi:hypothetical protein L3i22_011420 [Actinoplanes sp. L3-i22]|nr:hypothetical protein L3i22_011420 [Actinoplanes sp. L3-i22]